jgi:serine/threonine-protein kinase HipA
VTDRKLDIFFNDSRVGELFETGNVWTLRYSPEWAQRQDSFDLSPALPRSQLEHTDGATLRPVQWYFDNLLPEETLRTVLAKEANVPDEDAFGLLAYFGAESAGAIVLLASDQTDAAAGLKALHSAGELRAIRVISHIIIPEMVAKAVAIGTAKAAPVAGRARPWSGVQG